jgi:uncharacterized protein (TIGR02246 family)
MKDALSSGMSGNITLCLIQFDGFAQTIRAPLSIYHPKMNLPCAWFLLCSIFSPALLGSRTKTAEASITAVLNEQVEAWNSGDLKKFVSSYAPKCTLVGGNQISETTREEVLAHYEKKYPSPEARGKLTFSELTVHLLDAETATVTGHFHLERSPSGGGPAAGVFSLVFKRINGTWEIVLDHTS